MLGLYMMGPDDGNNRSTYVFVAFVHQNRCQLTSNHTVAYICLTCNHRVAYNRCMWDKDAIFKALGDSTRRLILDELSERNELTLYELTVRLITKHDLAISRQAIAKHLAALEDAGLVKSKRKGKYRVLMFNNEPLKDFAERMDRVIL